jgi:hypothetical protein
MPSLTEDFSHIAAELKKLEQEKAKKPEAYPQYLWTGQPIVDTAPSEYCAPDFDPA